jgi:phospholipid/cholesterol/gamma-HCH transport system permease protein
MTAIRVKCPERLDQETGRVLFEQVCGKKVRPEDIELDLSGTHSMDSFGGAWVLRIAERLQSRGKSAVCVGAADDVAAFMDMLEPGMKKPAEDTRIESVLFEEFGGEAINFLKESREFLELCTDAIYWTLVAPLEGRGFRFGAFMDELHEMGVRAVRIVCLMNFLLGLIIAMLSAKQVEAFGLQIFVANLVVIAFARELAAVMTAVVVSARTGAAIAAEIATMEVQEEIDALRGMGISVTQYLVAPKLLAMIVSLPCLTVLGMLSGTFGGALWGIGVLGFQPSIWYEQTLGATSMGDIGQGMLKSLFFAVAIALIGCHNGFRVTGGSRGVGRMTTRAVVMDIFTLIVIDIVFASFFYYILK